MSSANNSSADLKPRSLGGQILDYILEHLVAFLALFISGCGLFLTLDGREDIERLNAAQIRPIIEIVGEPEIIDASVSGGDVNTRRDWDAHVLELPVSLHVKFRVTIRNSGNAIAHIIHTDITDTTSYREVLRKHLLEAGRGTYRFATAVDSGMGVDDLASGASSTFEAVHTIRTPITSDSTVFHVIVMYMNDLGHLFDTYFVADMHIDWKRIRIQLMVDGRSDRWLPILDAQDRIHVTTLGRHAANSWPYSNEERDAILAYFQRNKQ